MSVLLSRARAGQCRWLCDAPVAPARSGAAPDLSGGQRVCGEATSFPTSYCAQHRLRIYEGAPAVRPPADLSSARHAPAPDLATELTDIFG